MDRRAGNDKDTARWPASSILLLGMFGARTPAGRRYHARCNIALAVIVGWMFFAAAARPVASGAGLDLSTALVPGAAFTYIAWEPRKYLLALDELQRRMQLEAMAWTYLTALPLAILIGGVVMLTAWRVNPMWFVALEPVRGAWLYVLSRRY